MAVKPKAITVLATYSMDELLDLVREKSRLMFSDAQAHVQALTNALMGGRIGTGEIGNGRRNRRTVKAGSPGKRGRRKGAPTLSSLLQEVLGKQAMNMENILESLNQAGWESRAKDPKRVLYLELRKQVEKGNVRKTERGMYARA